MRKIGFGALAALLMVFSGCDNIGTDYPIEPGPGFEGGTVAIFRNGTVFSFDYTQEYDGLQIVGYNDYKKGADGEISGGEKTSLSVILAPAGSGYAGHSRAMEFRHDEKDNVEEGWLVTLFDEPVIKASNYKTITFWAKYGGGLEPDAVEPPNHNTSVNITISVWGSSGAELTFSGNNDSPATNMNSILTDQRDGEWHQFTVPLTVLNQAPVWLRSDERIKQWQISVAQNAGRIYIDEIVLQ